MSTFWSQMAVEPKRQHRWYVTFNSNENSLSRLRFAAKKVNKPSSKVGSVQHKYLNHYFNFPGRLEWNDVTIDFASVADPDATKLIDFINTAAGYHLPITEYERETLSKQKFATNIGTIDIIQVNAEGVDIETWTLNNPFFTDVKYGDLDYSNEDIVTISVTVKYDWASLNKNRGTGGAVII